MSNEDTFDDALQGGIRDRAKEAKKTRQKMKSSFTRKYNAFQYLVKAEVQDNELKEAYDDLVRAYEALEKSHENYVDLVEEAIGDAEDGYLDESSLLHSKARVIFSQMFDKREKAKMQEGFGAAKSKVIVGMQAFERSCKMLNKLSLEKSISFADLRTELGKIEAQYESVTAEKAEVESKFPSADVTELTTKLELVVEEFGKCKEIGLTYLKADVNAGETTSRSSCAASTTKKETVMLPSFSGDEETAYLKYPVWRKQWASHIMDYEERYRSTMLLTHLDEKRRVGS